MAQLNSKSWHQRIEALATAIANNSGGIGSGGGGGGSTDVSTLETTTASQLTQLQTLNTAVDGVEGSIDGVELLLTQISAILGGINSNPATSNIGDFAIMGFIKRFMAHHLSTRTHVGTTAGSVGDNTIIAAPVAGQRIVITALRIQNATTTPASVLIKSGASTTLARLRTAADGSGMSEVYGPSNALRLGTASAFIVNLSAASTHDVSVQYYLETAASVLPV